MILGAGAALAYLITSQARGQPSPHLTWPVWPYYLCGVMFAVGAVVYGGDHGMLPRQRYGALKRRVEAADAEQLEPASLKPADPLLLTVDENEKWDLWRRAEYICALLLTITNTTNQPITVVNYGIGPDWQRGRTTPRRRSAARIGCLSVTKREPGNAGTITALRSRHEAGCGCGCGCGVSGAVIPPHGHVSGWLVTDCPRAWTGGRPRCTIKVTDALGNTYTKVIEQRDPQHYEY